jgi:hypothetical protein
MADSCVDEIVTFIIVALQKTPIASKGIDISVVRDRVLPIIGNVFNKLDNQDTNIVVKFVKNQSLLNNCIFPNVAKILQDGRITIDDAPAFLSMVVGIFESVKDFVSENPVVKITSNDITELTSLIIKIILSVTVHDQGMISMANVLIDSATKLVQIIIKPKSFSCKLICCKK